MYFSLHTACFVMLHVWHATCVLSRVACVVKTLKHGAYILHTPAWQHQFVLELVCLASKVQTVMYGCGMCVGVIDVMLDLNVAHVPHDHVA